MTTTPADYNVTAHQGATFNLDLTYKVGGVAVDLTGFSAAMQVREKPSSQTAVLSLVDPADITLGGAAGTIAITATAAATAALTPGAYRYDLELDSGSDVTRLLRGSFTIVAEVTK